MPASKNILFFSVKDAAAEIGVAPIDVVWSYANDSIKGQRISTAKTYVDSIRFTADQIVEAVRVGKIYRDRDEHLAFDTDHPNHWPTWFRRVSDSSDKVELRRIVEKCLPATSRGAALQAFIDNRGFDPTNPGDQYRRYTPARVNKSISFQDYKHFLLHSIRNKNYSGAIKAFLEDNTSNRPYKTDDSLCGPIERILAQTVLDQSKRLLDKANNSYFIPPGRVEASPLLRLCAMDRAERRKFRDECKTLVEDRLPAIRTTQSFRFIRDADVNFCYTTGSKEIFHGQLVQSVIQRIIM